MSELKYTFSRVERKSLYHAIHNGYIYAVAMNYTENLIGLNDWHIATEQLTSSPEANSKNVILVAFNTLENIELFINNTSEIFFHNKEIIDLLEYKE